MGGVRTRRWLARAVSAALAGIALVSCGGSAHPTVDGARSVIKTFGDDLTQSRFGDACNLMTPAAQAQAGGGDANECAARLALARQLISSSTLQAAFNRLGKAPITLTGNRAVLPDGGGGTTSLEWSAGKWLIGRSSGR